MIITSSAMWESRLSKKRDSEWRRYYARQREAAEGELATRMEDMPGDATHPVVEQTHRVSRRPGEPSWQLDPSDVSWGTTGRSSAPFSKGPTRHGGTPARDSLTLRLTHTPTGITVEKEAVGPFTRTQAKDAKARLWDELLPILESKVAVALRIPGR